MIGKRFLGACLLALMTVSSGWAQTEPIPLRPVPGRHVDMSWFRERRLGLFLVWGLYTQTQGIWKGQKGTEFISLQYKIPNAEMAELARQMNPVNFDAEAIVLAAKRAGMGYIVITAKHQEGFVMYDSPCNDFNIVKMSPWGRDPLKELSDACQKHDIKFCVYYSLGRDFEDPDVGSNWPRIGGRSNDWDFPDEKNKRFERYFERKVKPQIREILTQYKVDMLWFDVHGFCTPFQSLELMQMIEHLSPGCLVNDRVGNSYGDFFTPEQTVLKGICREPWESCVTVGRVWSYTCYDTIYKSSEVLARLATDIVAKGGNLLLSVPPTHLGELTPMGLDRLRALGDWMAVNGEAVNGTQPWHVYGESFVPVRRTASADADMPDTVKDETDKDTEPDIRFTCKPGVLYVMARSWKDPWVRVNDLLLTPEQQITKVELLGYSGPIDYTLEGNGIEMSLPSSYRPEIPLYVYKLTLSE